MRSKPPNRADLRPGPCARAGAEPPDSRDSGNRVAATGGRIDGGPRPTSGVARRGPGTGRTSGGRGHRCEARPNSSAPVRPERVHSEALESGSPSGLGPLWITGPVRSGRTGVSRSGASRSTPRRGDSAARIASGTAHSSLAAAEERAPLGRTPSAEVVRDRSAGGLLGSTSFVPLELHPLAISQPACVEGVAGTGRSGRRPSPRALRPTRWQCRSPRCCSATSPTCRGAASPSPSRRGGRTRGASPPPRSRRSPPPRRSDVVLLRPAERWRVVSARVVDEPAGSDHPPSSWSWSCYPAGGLASPGPWGRARGASLRRIASGVVARANWSG